MSSCHAYDRGINYFDSADTYSGGESETVIGNALKGKRDKVYLTSKTMAGATDSKATIMESLEGSLKRLQTDHIDVYFNHAINDINRIKNPEWHEFTDAAKKQGKIRFAGMSGHAGNLIECLDWGIDSGRFDVILCAYNFGQDPAFYQRYYAQFRFRRDSDRFATRHQEGQGEGRRRDGDEDAARCASQRHASV